MQDGFSGVRVFPNRSESTVTGGNGDAWTDHLATAYFWLGHGHHGNDLAGGLDDVRFYSRALSASEATAHFRPALSTAGLVGAWSFDREISVESLAFVNAHYRGCVGIPWYDSVD